MDEHGISLRTNMIFADFYKKIDMRFKSYPNTLAHQAIPLSKGVTVLDTKWLTREASEEEIQHVINQINPLKSLRSEGMHGILPKILAYNL